MVTNIGIRSLLPIVLNIGTAILNFASDTLNFLTLTFSSAIAEYIPQDGFIGGLIYDTLTSIVESAGLSDITLLSFVFGFVVVMFFVDLALRFIP